MIPPALCCPGKRSGRTPTERAGSSPPDFPEAQVGSSRLYVCNRAPVFHLPCTDEKDRFSLTSSGLLKIRTPFRAYRSRLFRAKEKGRFFQKHLPFLVETEGFDLRCGAGRLAALGCPRQPIHSRSGSNPTGAFPNTNGPHLTVRAVCIWKRYRVLIEYPGGGFTCPLGGVKFQRWFKVNDRDYMHY